MPPLGGRLAVLLSLPPVRVKSRRHAPRRFLDGIDHLGDSRQPTAGTFSGRLPGLWAKMIWLGGFSAMVASSAAGD